MLRKPLLIGCVSAAVLVVVVSAALVLGRREASPDRDGRAGSQGGNSPARAPDELRVVRRVAYPQDRTDYLGSAACVSCHLKQAPQSRSRHALTLRPVSQKIDGPMFQQRCSVIDDLQGTHYEVLMTGGQCVLRAYDATHEMRASASYAFGAGNVGVTYVSRSPEGAIQLRVSWYPKGGWKFTPGLGPGSPQAGPLGELLDPSAEIACFSCHATVLVRDEGRLDLERSILGVGCETCHGPGRAHVEALRKREPDLQMVRLRPRRVEVAQSVCAPCHGVAAMSGDGDPSQDSALPRLQTIALAKSKCSATGALTCMSCHDPHADAKPAPRETHNGVCGSCHTGRQSGSRSCPVQPRGDCVSCHMPAQEIGLANGQRFRNHWIKVWKGSGG